MASITLDDISNFMIDHLNSTDRDDEFREFKSTNQQLSEELEIKRPSFN